MRRTLTLFGTLFLLWVIVAQVNHLLSVWRVYLFVGALFVAFAALTQPVRAGLFASLLGGLLCDANAPPGIFGLQTLFFAAAFLTLFHVRDRVPRDDTTGRVVVTLLLNLALFLALTLAQLGNSPAPGAVWPRLLMDLVCSQLFLALIAPWFFALQTRALALARVGREDLA